MSIKAGDSRPLEPSTRLSQKTGFTLLRKVVDSHTGPWITATGAARTWDQVSSAHPAQVWSHDPEKLAGQAAQHSFYSTQNVVSECGTSLQYLNSPQFYIRVFLATVAIGFLLLVVLNCVKLLWDDIEYKNTNKQFHLNTEMFNSVHFMFITCKKTQNIWSL